MQLSSNYQIHPVVNVSRVQLYKPQVEGQKVVLPQLVVIDGEEKYKVEKNLKQEEDMRKKQVFSLIEGIYSRDTHMERTEKFREYERVG